MPPLNPSLIYFAPDKDMSTDCQRRWASLLTPRGDANAEFWKTVAQALGDWEYRPAGRYARLWKSGLLVEMTQCSSIYCPLPISGFNNGLWFRDEGRTGRPGPRPMTSTELLHVRDVISIELGKIGIDTAGVITTYM